MLKMNEDTQVYIDQIDSALGEIKGLLILYSLNNHIYETLVARQDELVELKNSLELVGINQTVNSEEARKLKRGPRRALGDFYRFINQIS